MEIFILCLLSIPLTKYINKNIKKYEDKLAYDNGYKIIETDIKPNEEKDYVAKFYNRVESFIDYIPGINVLFSIYIYWSILNDPFLLQKYMIDGNLESLTPLKEAIEDKKCNIQYYLDLPLLLSVKEIDYEGQVNYFVTTYNTINERVILVRGSLSNLSKWEKQVLFNNYFKEKEEGMIFDYPNTGDEEKINAMALDALDRYLENRKVMKKIHEKKELKKIYKGD